MVKVVRIVEDRNSVKLFSIRIIPRETRRGLWHADINTVSEFGDMIVANRAYRPASPLRIHKKYMVMKAWSGAK
jgi:flagellar basal body rod protein FlgC